MQERPVAPYNNIHLYRKPLRMCGPRPPPAKPIGTIPLQLYVLYNVVHVVLLVLVQNVSGIHVKC